MSTGDEREILNIDEAAALVGVSVKTFIRVRHTENIPARKIGREWKFSRRALIDWVGRGRSADFYRDSVAERPDPHDWAHVWRAELNRGGFEAYELLRTEVVDAGR